MIDEKRAICVESVAKGSKERDIEAIMDKLVTDKQVNEETSVEYQSAANKDNIYSCLQKNSYGGSYFDRYKTYTDLQEIDWLHEYKKERQFAKRVSKLGSLSGALQRVLFNSEKWVIIIMAAVITGAFVSFIDSSSIWVNDLRNGYCTTSFFLSRITCCEDLVEGQVCDQWHNWQSQANSDASAHSSQTLGHFVVYIATSVVLTMTAYLVTSHVQFASKSGISEVKAIISGLVFDEFLSVRVLAAKTVSLVLVVGAGLWVGKEGPLVHVSCCIMSTVCVWMSRNLALDEAMKRELLAAAVAAGISVAFNAPIGGVLFILEQGYSNLKTSNIMWKAFICATAAVAVLLSLHPFTEGQNVLFSVANNKDWLSVEIFPFMVLGVFGGVYGGVFSRLNLWFARFRGQHITGATNAATRSRRMLFEVLSVAVVTPVLTYPLVFGKLSLSLLITRLFRDCEPQDGADVIGGLCSFNDDAKFHFRPFFLLVFTGIEGFVLAAYTYGMLVPSGVLMPSLAIGACFGRALGLVIDYVQVNHPHWAIFRNCPSYFAPDAVATSKCISTGAYGVVGAAAFLAGITKMTVSVVVIMFELTGALTYVLPIMISVLIAKVINDGLVLKNFYELWLRFSLFYSLDQNYKDLKPFPNICAKDVMITANMACLSESAQDTDLPSTLFHVFFLNDADNGSLTVKTILDHLDKLDEHDKLKSTPFNVLGFPVLQSRSQPTLFGWVSRNELRIELARLALIPHYNINQNVSFKKSEHNLPPIKNTLISPLITSHSSTNFEMDNGDFDSHKENIQLTSQLDNQGPSNTSLERLFQPASQLDNQGPRLFLHHLIETNDLIPVFKSTVAIATVADLFYKVNYNYLLFTDFRGNFQGIITKYYMIDLIESGFQTA